MSDVNDVCPEDKFLDEIKENHDDIINENPINDKQFYRGDKKLPRENAKFNFTPTMVKELVKCKDNIVHFAENHFTIVNLDRGKEKIQLYPAQKRILKSLSKNRFVALLASRQVGKCFKSDTKVKIRNKTTGIIEEITIESFYKDKESVINACIDFIRNEKFIKSYNIDDYEVFTDTGWEDIEAIHKTILYDVWRLETTNHFLECADEHIVIGEYGNEIYVYDLKIGDKIITESGIEEVLLIEKLNIDPEYMYDLSLKSDKHTFYTNGILSHNTTLTTVYSLWNTCFFDDQRVIIVANKENTAINIFKKVRLAYELLPNYLKPGVKEWGKTGATFANGSSIGISTTTSTAARGDSASCLIVDEAAFIECVHKNTKISLKNKNTEEIKIVKIIDLFSEDINDDIINEINTDLIRYQENNEWEILTNEGWSDFKGIAEYSAKELINVKFRSGKSIIVSKNHCFIDKNSDKVFAKDSLDIKLKTEDGIDIVIDTIDAGIDLVYDIVDVKKNNVYYTNGILSHNTHFMEEFWKSIIPVISSSKKAKIFMVSTPNGVLNKFYDIYSDAEKGKNNWKSERIDWQEVPGRNEKWKAEMIATLGSEESFNQEFGNQFLDSTNGAVGIEVLEKFKNNVKDPLWKSADNTYRVFEMPDKEKIYVIGVDVGEGIGRASSTAQILDITDLSDIKQVAVYGSNIIEPFHFGNILFNICASWGNPPLLIERNNCGAQVIDALAHTLFYEKIVSYSKLTNSGGGKTTRHLGVFSHNNLRFNAVTNLRYWINFLQVVSINDADTITEFETFVRYPNGTYRKSGDTHRDDYVMGLVWALFMLEPDLCQQYFTIDEHDDQNKPLKLSRNDSEYSYDELYSLKDLITGEVINICSKVDKRPPIPSKYIPIYGDADSILDGREIDIDDLSSMGYTIYIP